MSDYALYMILFIGFVIFFCIGSWYHHKRFCKNLDDHQKRMDEIYRLYR
jgi:putative Mn2+ efflux pump MntP